MCLESEIRLRQLPFRAGLALVEIGKRMAYIDHTGRIVWQESE